MRGVDSVTDRRRFLGFVTIGATTGLTGCVDQSSSRDDSSGQSGGNIDTEANDDSETGSGADGSATDLTCSNLTDEYDPHETGARPVVFTFEYPSIYGALEDTRTAQAITYDGRQPIAEGEVSMSLVQSTKPTPPREPPEDVGGTTTEFNGETVAFYGASIPSQVTWGGYLPYDIDGERMTFHTGVNLYGPSGDSSGCGDVLREAAEYLISSMEVNPETTIESEVGDG